MIVMLLIVALLETGCEKITKPSASKTIEDESQKEDWKISVWTTYWDVERIQVEVANLKDHIKNFCYFAAYFNNKNKLILPQVTAQTFHSIEKNFGDNEWVNYLTIVNDKIKEDGTSSLKDTKLLYALFANEEDMDRHIAEILNIVTAGGYDGIEIDYEAISKDMDLWKLYQVFCRKLYKAASEVGLKMRVVLEPNVPLEKLNLPEGPDYIVMCYNLHGVNTEPGPKADSQFIKKMIKKFSDLPGNKEFALATGGFDWSREGETKALTEIQAEDLIKQYNAETERDNDSQCIKFFYLDREGKKHEVWYADTVTLHYWREIILESGEYGISLWRLGGNNSEQL